MLTLLSHPGKRVGLNTIVWEGLSKEVTVEVMLRNEYELIFSQG